MSNPVTCSGSPSAISSPVLAAGLMPFAPPDGLMTGLYGLDLVRVSLSPRQALAKGLRTQDTSGQVLPGSSSSQSLQSSLESRLQARLSTLGSTLYTLTWKPWITPSGPSRSRLRGSVRRTYVTDFTGWPTPTASLADKGVRSTEGGLREAMRNHGPDLAAAVTLTGWPTPMAGTPARNGNNAAGNNDSSRKTVEVVSYHLCGWTTPTTRDHKDTPGMVATRNGRERNDQLPRQAYLCTPARLTASGELLTGSDAGMESGGQLRPEHSRWLMGYPAEWDACAAMVMPSTRKRLKSS